MESIYSGWIHSTAGGKTDYAKRIAWQQFFERKQSILKRYFTLNKYKWWYKI